MKFSTQCNEMLRVHLTRRGKEFIHNFGGGGSEELLKNTTWKTGHHKMILKWIL